MGIRQIKLYIGHIEPYNKLFTFLEEQQPSPCKNPHLASPLVSNLQIHSDPIK